MRIANLVMAFGLITVCLGCGSDPGAKLPATVDAIGIVTLDGKPVEGATVVFIANAGDRHATGTTDASGKFSLDAFTEKKGAIPGGYKVEVNKTVVTSAGGVEGEATVNVNFGLPVKYSNFATSKLTATIPPAGSKDLKLELSSK